MSGRSWLWDHTQGAVEVVACSCGQEVVDEGLELLVGQDEEEDVVVEEDNMCSSDMYRHAVDAHCIADMGVNEAEAQAA